MLLHDEQVAAAALLQVRLHGQTDAIPVLSEQGPVPPRVPGVHGVVDLLFHKQQLLALEQLVHLQDLFVRDGVQEQRVTVGFLCQRQRWRE